MRGPRSVSVPGQKQWLSRRYVQKCFLGVGYTIMQCYTLCFSILVFIILYICALYSLSSLFLFLSPISRLLFTFWLGLGKPETVDYTRDAPRLYYSFCCCLVADPISHSGYNSSSRQSVMTWLGAVTRHMQRLYTHDCSTCRPRATPWWRWSVCCRSLWLTRTIDNQMTHRPLSCIHTKLSAIRVVLNC